LKGNWGEQFIAAELASQGCLIRHVPQGHDVGVDLYCETTYKGTPWMHFWCQVKTLKGWRGKSKSFKQGDIDYWLKQPIPVFIFLVPDEGDKKIDFYFICTPLSMNNGRTREFFKIANRSALFMFLHHTLREMTHEWDLRKGKVSPLPYPLPSKEVEFLPGATRKYERIIFDSLCWTLWRLNSDILFPEPRSRSAVLNKTVDLTNEEKARLKRVKPYIDALACLLGDKGNKHHECYDILGAYFEMSGQFQKARAYFQKALTIIGLHLVENPSVLGLPDFKREVERRIQRVEEKMRRGR
jgi:hypothetical protein